VKAGINPLERLFDSVRIGDIALYHLDLLRQVLPASARQIIDDPNCMPLCQ